MIVMSRVRNSRIKLSIQTRVILWEIFSQILLACTLVKCCLASSWGLYHFSYLECLDPGGGGDLCYFLTITEGATLFFEVATLSSVWLVFAKAFSLSTIPLSSMVTFSSLMNFVSTWSLICISSLKMIPKDDTSITVSERVHFPTF